MDVNEIKAEESSVAENIPPLDSPVHEPDIDAKIAELAYYKAENRGFLPGHELDDWLDAEHEIMLKN